MQYKENAETLMAVYIYIYIYIDTFTNKRNTLTWQRELFPIYNKKIVCAKNTFYKSNKDQQYLYGIK